MRQISFIKSLILLCWLASFSIQLNAQKKTLFSESFEPAISKVYLLKNELNVLPFKELPKRVTILQTGFEGQEKFNEMVMNYIPAKIIGLDFYHYNSDVLKQENDYIIIAADLETYQHYASSFFSGQDNEKIILIVFSNKKENIEYYKSLNSESIILAPKNETGISLAAQACFDGAAFHDFDDKKITTGKTRLGYHPKGLENKYEAFLNKKIDSIANYAIEQKAFPGMQVLVIKDSEVVFHKPYGFHTYKKIRPVKKTDIYDLASVSKVTTALPVLMKYYGDAKIELDDPLVKYFPKFKKSNKADLTLKEILAHQAGLRPWIPYWKNTVKEDGSFKRRTFKSKFSKRYNVKITDQLFLHKKYKKKIYKAIKKSEVSDEKKYKYSGLAFYLFPEMVSNLTGMEYEAYLKKTFYHPLGANTTTFNPYLHFPKERIIPTERDTFFRMTQLHGTVHDEGAAMMGGLSANAGLFSSANDLAKIFQMYLNGGTYGGKRYISEDAIHEFTKCHFPENGNRRGLGFDKPLLEYDVNKSSVAKDASKWSYGHSGYTGTFVWADPEYDLIYIFFSNRVFPTRENRKIYQLSIRPSIHQAIYDAIK